MRLIDADALLDQNNWTIKQYSEEEADAWRDGIALMKKNIEKAPTIKLEPFYQWSNIANHPPVHKRILKNVCGQPERMVSDYVLVWSDKFQICTYGRYYEDDGWSIHDVMMTNEDIAEQKFTKWMNMPKPTEGDAQ